MIKYIFSINTGRSGSHYLSNILAEFESISSFHEPHPIMNGEAMKEYMDSNPVLMSKMIEEKLESISLLHKPNTIYAETNHTFIKGFGWLLPQYIPQENMGVIFLKRDKKAIAKSYKKISCTPMTPSGLAWLINPLKKNPIIPISQYDKLFYLIFMSPLHYSLNRFLRSRFNLLRFWTQKLNLFKSKELKFLEWYVEETYALGKEFKIKYPNIKVFETSLDKLNDIEEFERMFHFFGIPFKPKDSFFEKLNKKTNIIPT